MVWALLLVTRAVFELFAVFFLHSSLSLPVKMLLCGCQLPLCTDIMISVQTTKIKPPLLHVKCWINHVFHFKRSKFCRQTDVSETQNTQESEQSLTLISWLFLWIAQVKKTEWKMLRWTIKLSTVWSYNNGNPQRYNQASNELEENILKTASLETLKHI